MIDIYLLSDIFKFLSFKFNKIYRISVIIILFNLLKTIGKEKKINKLLLVIDVQKNFINEYTNPILPKIEELVNSGQFKNVAFTRFINDVNSIWYKELNYN